jgi:hypothetical protein
MADEVSGVSADPAQNIHKLRAALQAEALAATRSDREHQNLPLGVSGRAALAAAILFLVKKPRPDQAERGSEPRKRSPNPEERW